MTTIDEIKVDPMREDGHGNDGYYDNDDDDDDESIRTTSTSRQLTDRLKKLRKTDETSFINDNTNDIHPLIYREISMDEAWEKIKLIFPKADPKTSPFTAEMDEFDRVRVRLKISGGKKHFFFNQNGELNEKLPITITKSLGPSAEEIITVNEENNSLDRARIKKLKEQRERTDIKINELEETINNINEIEERIGERNQMNERIQERMSLRNRIKAIFKKYGFTVTAVVTAVGVVIGVIVSNLKTGLAKVANGVGNGLKDIGKKLAQILPGMVGAIASFIFRTAGEVVGFLAKNAWLLIVAVVVYFVESLKKKNGKKK